MKNLKLKFPVGIVALVTLALLLAVRPAMAAQAKMPASMEVGGASIGGAFYVVAGGVAKLLEEKLKIPVTAAVTEGSRENIRLLDRSQVQLAVIASNNAYPAYNGVMGFDKKHPFLNAVMGLYPNAFAYMTLPQSPVHSFADLKGKRVGVGTGRTWDAFLKPLFRAHGIDYKDFTPVYAGLGDLFTQLGDGIIVAAPGVVSGGNPIPAAQRLAAEKGAAYFGPDPAAVKKVLKELPFMSSIRIPKGTPTFTSNIDTVDIGGPSLYVRNDMDEELVYRITKLLHQNLGNMAQDIRYFNYAKNNPEVLTKGGGVPFHPGALRYWKEAGLWKE